MNAHIATSILYTGAPSKQKCQATTPNLRLPKNTQVKIYNNIDQFMTFNLPSTAVRCEPMATRLTDTKALEPPRKSVELQDPGAHELCMERIVLA